MRRGTLTAAWIGIALLLASPAVFAAAEVPQSQVLSIDFSSRWLDTGRDFKVGDTVTISASGEAVVSCRDRWGQGQELKVGPEGTFLVSDGLAAQHYPLPSGIHGPAPCFCLVGRIGEGKPFFVGQTTSFASPNSGRLLLGVNAFDAAKFTGFFRVRVTHGGGISPLWIDRAANESVPTKGSNRAARVVVFYVDGLRPDVVREMVGMGHLPTIRDLFVDGGTWLKNTFTAFPSDTITSNGTMWTGCFSDRHGLKGQVRFSRVKLDSESYLEPLGPGRSSQLLAPQGIDKLTTDGEQTLRSWVDGESSAKMWRKQRVTETPPLYHFLRQEKLDWATGVLPIMTDVPPLLWSRSMTRELPWFESHNAWQYIDDANANYGIRHLLSRESPVTVLWFPETDSVSHKCSRGQFGTTRKTIAQADLLIKRVTDELRATGRFDSTCFMLVSDHGHHGGRTTHLKHFDLANDLFFNPRQVDEHGQWTSGGLGLSVRMHRFWNKHPEHHQRSFVFVDGDSSGVARISFPRHSFHSRDWTRANSPGDLLRYSLADDVPPIDLVATLATAKACNGEAPVDLVLMKLNASSILVSTSDRAHAVIDRQCSADGRWMYRYRPVSKVWSDDQGGVFFKVNDAATQDPLLLTQRLSAAELREYYDEETWLKLTADWYYPDSVVVLTRHLLWQDNLSEHEKEFAPDLVVTARPGWYFGLSATPGTNHGYPLRDAMNASWFVSGPGIRRGTVVDSPARLVDLTPTILDVLGFTRHESWFDGRPRRQIYATDSDERLTSRPVNWQDIDLGGWAAIPYQPLGESSFKPASINHTESPLDLTNAAYNVVAIADMSVFRIFDDVLSPLHATAEPGPAQSKTDRIDTRMRHSARPLLKDVAPALNVPEFSISDYSVTSLGNLQRANKAVDWLQGRGRELDRKLVEPRGKTESTPAWIVNQTVDGTQSAFWEVYRLGQRLVIKTVDETLINGAENTVDRTLNSWRQSPAVVPAR